MKKHFTEEQRIKAIELAAKNAIIDYLRAVDDSLSSTQTQKLTEVLQALSPAVE